MAKSYFTDADAVDCGCGASRVHDFDGVLHGAAHFRSGADDDDANLLVAGRTATWIWRQRNRRFYHSYRFRF